MPLFQDLIEAFNPTLRLARRVAQGKRTNTGDYFATVASTVNPFVSHAYGQYLNGRDQADTFRSVQDIAARSQKIASQYKKKKSSQKVSTPIVTTSTTRATSEPRVTSGVSSKPVSQVTQQTQQTEQPTQQQQVVPQEIGYNPQFDYSQGARALGSLGIRDYASLVNFVKANPNHPFAKDLANRFGSQLNDQRLVESTLGVRGHYGRGILGGGDLSDMMKSMATWAGTRRAEYDRNNRYHWDTDANGRFVQVAGSSPNGYGVGKVTGNTYYTNPQTVTTQTTTQQTTEGIKPLVSTLPENEGNADIARITNVYQARPTHTPPSDEWIAKTGTTPQGEYVTEQQRKEAFARLANTGFHKNGGLISKNPIERFKKGGKKKENEKINS